VSRDLHPTEGARLLLLRDRDLGATASYRAAIYTPSETFEAVALLGEDGAVELGATGATGELHAALEMLARLTARGAAKRREDGLETWPVRVLRWRGTGRGG
jgi:hypothetical protein